MGWGGYTRGAVTSSCPKCAGSRVDSGQGSFLHMSTFVHNRLFPSSLSLFLAKILFVIMGYSISLWRWAFSAPLFLPLIVAHLWHPWAGIATMFRERVSLLSLMLLCSAVCVPGSRLCCGSASCACSGFSFRDNCYKVQTGIRALIWVLYAYDIIGGFVSHALLMFCFKLL